jgi:hypothetical protein
MLTTIFDLALPSFPIQLQLLLSILIVDLDWLRANDQRMRTIVQEKKSIPCLKPLTTLGDAARTGMEYSDF